MNELSLFSGAGGGLLASKYFLGWNTIGYVEIEEYCQKVIRQRIKDGLLDNAPIFSDIRAFINSGCAELYRGITDVISGGFPCQDISCAGTGEGIDGKRSGLWKEMFRSISIIQPRYVFVENSAALLVRGFGKVAGDMASMGYNCQWGVLSGKSIGAPIERKRIFAAFTNGKYGKARVGNLNNWADALFRKAHKKCNELWLQAPPTNIRVGNGVADYMDRVKAIGNGQIPQVAATAWNILTNSYPATEGTVKIK